MAILSPARRCSCSANWTTSLVLPAPGGEATTTAGSPDQAAKSAAPSVRSVWCGATGGGTGDGAGSDAVDEAADGESVRTVRELPTLAATRRPRSPRRAEPPGDVASVATHPRARNVG